MRQRILSISLMTLAALLLAACGSAAAQAGQTSDSAPSGSGTSLDISYPNALPLRNQLLLGTLRLDETAQPLSAAQTAALLPCGRASAVP